MRLSRGFTLIELSIVIVIAGLLIVPIMQAFDLYVIEKTRSKTKESATIARDATINFYYDLTGSITNQRFPCPADPTLDPTDKNYGKENRDPATGECGFPWAALADNKIDTGELLDDGDCTTNTDPVQFPTIPRRGICRFDLKAADNPTDASGNKARQGIVLVGAVPFRTLGLREVDVIDGYGNLLTYAVTKEMTVAPMPIDKAAVHVSNYDRETVSASGAVTWQTPDEDLLPFIVISHGKNRKGAYNLTGQRNDCDGVVDNNGRDTANCDLDAYFISQKIGGIGDTSFDSESQSPQFYFDDYIGFGDSLVRGLWSKNENGALFNATTGNIGIGKDDPDTKVDISGDLRADNLLSKMLCGGLDSATGQPINCFSPTAIGGERNATDVNKRAEGCPDKQALIGFDKGKAVCKALKIETTIISNCPANCYAIGIGNDGKLVCTSDGTNRC